MKWDYLNNIYNKQQTSGNTTLAGQDWHKALNMMPATKPAMNMVTKLAAKLAAKPAAKQAMNMVCYWKEPLVQEDKCNAANIFLF